MSGYGQELQEALTEIAHAHYDDGTKLFAPQNIADPLRELRDIITKTPSFKLPKISQAFS